MNKPYRKLTTEEIGRLLMQGCHCDDWNLVEVSADFIPDQIFNATFSGYTLLGRFDEEITLFGGVRFKTGIRNAFLSHCIVHDNALIHNIRSYIANYRIGPRAVIHNVSHVATDGKSSFGNGTHVDAINEVGGRDIVIYDHLSSHMAYIMALYRHRTEAIQQFNRLVSNYVQFVTDDMGDIEEGVSIVNCDSLRNVRIGPYARLEGVSKLENGSINSTAADPVTIGQGVIMENFIVCSGSKITDATLVSNCFIGQGCILEKHYSAVHSLFFANCQGLHGEASSIFAGPYTVSHHKSSLLIAGMFSFLNAGSGSNQSNHMYKLGPIHQGIVERGAKTTSDSYILWPSRIGAFSLVMGRHKHHSDTTSFPFSYLREENNETFLTPAINLRSIGTVRDSQKWPARDLRKDPNLLDMINFNLLSPYTVQKMIEGLNILKQLRDTQNPSPAEYIYEHMHIKHSALERGIVIYEQAICKFLGNSLISRLQGKKIGSVKEMQKLLAMDTELGYKDRWIDISGMICPARVIDNLLSEVESGSLNTLEEVNAFIRSVHHHYYVYEWSWAYGVLEEHYQKKPDTFSPATVINIIRKWEESVFAIDEMLYKDAQQEFLLNKQVGFGIDGDLEVRERDFASVRGKFEDHPMVVEITRHKARKKQLGDSMIALLSNMN